MEELQKAFTDFLDALGKAYPDGGEISVDKQVAVLQALSVIAAILDLKVE